MKKFLALFLSSLMLSAFYSCGETEESNEVEKNEATTEEETAATTEDETAATTEEETEATTEEIDAKTDEQYLEFDSSKMEYKDFNFDALTISVPSFMDTDEPTLSYDITTLGPSFSDPAYKNLYGDDLSLMFIDMQVDDYSSDQFFSDANETSDVYTIIDKLFLKHLDYVMSENANYNRKYEPDFDSTLDLKIGSLIGRAYVYTGSENGRSNLLGVTDVLYDLGRGKVYYIDVSDFEKYSDIAANVLDHINATMKFDPKYNEEITNDNVVSNNDKSQVLMDQNGIKITYNGIEQDSIFVGIKVLIENNTDKTYTVQVRNSSIDGYMIEPVFSSEIAPGKKCNDEISIFTDDLTKNGLTPNQISQAELNFHCFNSDDWLDSFDSDVIAFSLK